MYKARQTKLDRLVALKIIRPEAAGDPAFAERFTREARTLARLNHPAILKVFDLVTLRGRLALITERVDGADLSDLSAPPRANDPSRMSNSANTRRARRLHTACRLGSSSLAVARSPSKV